MTLYNDDCFNIFPQIKDNSIHLILSDIPYNLTSMKWDSPIDLDKMWKEFNRILVPNGKTILFCSGVFTFALYNSNISDFRYKLIWEKNVPTGMTSAKYRPMKYYEEICVFYKEQGTYNPIMKERVGKHKECYKYEHYCDANNHIDLDKKKKKYHPNLVQPSDVLHFNVVPNRNGKLHPTQKPVDLCEWLIQTYSNESDIVLDPFMGSGTTGIACKLEGFDFIGIEKEKEYCEIAEARIKAWEEIA